MELLISKESNNALISYTRKIHQNLLDKKIISSPINPDCGYFVFAKINEKDKNLFSFMNGEYFEQKKYPDHIRINLLNKAFQKYS